MTNDEPGRSTPARFFYNKRFRANAAQALTVLVLAGIVAFFVINAADNMRRAGIASGFGFLWRDTGVDVLMSLIPYGPSSTYARLLLVGVLNTALISAIGIVLATVIGLFVGIGRLSRNPALAGLCGAYIELVRNIPLLLWVFFWYYGILGALPAPRESLRLFDAVFLNKRGLTIPWPEAPAWLLALPVALAIAAIAAWAVKRWATARQALTGAPFPVPTAAVLLLAGATVVGGWIAVAATSWNLPVPRGFNIGGGITLIPEFVALTAALISYTAGFIAENVRGGILSVSVGQREAALALGLTRGQTMRLVILPQALRVIIPPLTSQYLSLIKNSSFGAAIAMPEIVQVFVGTALNQTGQATEVIAITLAIYLSVNLLVSGFMGWWNRRVALVTR